MLAAASPVRDGFPALFQLALEIVSAERVLPEQLSEHLNRVVREALDIAANPSDITHATLPEAIQLALELQRSDELRSAIDSSREGKMTADAAKSILALERKLEAAR